MHPQAHQDPIRSRPNGVSKADAAILQAGRLAVHPIAEVLPQEVLEVHILPDLQVRLRVHQADLQVLLILRVEEDNTILTWFFSE